MITWLFAHLAAVRGWALPWIIVVASLVFLAFSIAFHYLFRGRKASLETAPSDPPHLAATTPEPEKPQLTTGAQPKLTFEVDEDASQVRVGSGPHEVRAIYADIKLRCFKASEHPMAIRGFHASLHKKWPLGDKAPVLPQEDGAWIWQFPSNKEISTKEVWTVKEPSTEYRIYHFILHLTPQIQASLSDNHVLRVTMDAVGQEQFSQPVYVHDWHVIEGGFSTISLKPPEELPLAATKEINRLKGQLRSYEKTNEELGRRNTEKQGQIDGLNDTVASLERQSKIVEEGHGLELLAIKIKSNGIEDELKEARREIGESRKREAAALQEKEAWYKYNEMHERILGEWNHIHVLAKKQAEHISDYVVITEHLPHGLSVEGDRFVGLTLRIKNNSLFEITIEPRSVTGHLHFNEKPRRESVHAPTTADHHPVERLKPEKDATLYIEQPLLASEAEIINGAAKDSEFWLGSLTIPLRIDNAPPELQIPPNQILRFPSPFDKIQLVKFFDSGADVESSKLEIEIKETIFDFVDDSRTGTQRGIAREPCYVTMSLRLKHARPTPIEIDRFKLTLRVDGKEHVSWAESKVASRRLVTAQGEELFEATRSDNLNEHPPLILPDDQPPVEGTLQFVFDDLRYLEVLTEETSLGDSPFTLALRDTDKEWHAADGVLPAEGVRYVNP